MADRQRILIVDDERLNRKVLTELLEDRHDIVVAKNGPQALQWVKTNTDIDLILLDIMMPGMDGYDVLVQLKQIDHARDIPVIFISARDTAEDEERGLRLGAADYISKPFHAAVVRLRVETHLRIVRQHKLLETLAGHDGLTEIPNRRLFDQVLEKELARSARCGSPLSVAMIDVDFFKQYNDCYGHAQGDHVLKSVAQVLCNTLSRKTDFVARYGGEEFALILPDTDIAGAAELGEKIRLTVEAMKIAHDKSAVADCVTLSIGGITALQVPSCPTNLLELADARLYEAKQTGRNKVIWKMAG